MRIVTLPWLVLIVVALPVSAQTVDEIVGQYVEARGGKANLEAVQTVRANGTAILGGGMEAPFHYEWKKPNMIRFELTFQGITEIQASDGKTAWFIDPPGVTEPREMSSAQFAMLNDGVDYVGPLVDYASKGHKVTLMGKEEVEGTEAYKLEVVKQDGMVEYCFIDAEYFLEILQLEKHQTPGGEFELEVTWGDYKEVGGVLLPHSWHRKPRGGQGGMSLMFEQIELNVDLPDSRFEMPAGEAQEGE